jgi:hypothetical protein
MGLDIRWPIGTIFTIYGIVLVIFGATTNRAIFEQHSLGINIDLVWGAAMLAFGLLMGGFAFNASRQNKL